MNADQALSDLARECGVLPAYHDNTGQYRVTEPATQRALLCGLGIACDSDQEVAETLDGLRQARADRWLPAEQVIIAGQAARLDCAIPVEWQVLSESGAEIAAGHSDDIIILPPLPMGVHVLHSHSSKRRAETTLLVRPPQAPQLPERAGRDRSWGICTALYGLNERDNGGLGNYQDLGRLAAVLGQHGADFLGLNPVHPLGWSEREMISPYSPSDRRFLSTDHIAVGTPVIAPTDDLIDYAAFRAWHRPALEREYQQGLTKADRSAFDDYCAAEGQPLIRFALFEALAEQHGTDFRNWPAALQDPDRVDPAPYADRIAFHSWLQWRASSQIAAAQRSALDGGMALGLYLDLAVGARRGGAEAWTCADTIAQGVSLGAPPDHLSPAGQAWNLAAHAPNKMRAARYAPLRQMLRRLMRNSGILRIDHVLGFLRSFWLPDDGSPGGYVAQPLDALLAVVAIEAAQNKCIVVGEDLGLVPDGFRDQLAGAGIYSYSVWQYEHYDDGWLFAPQDLRANALACFGTHDTPTLAGFWQGRDIDWWFRLGWVDGESAGHQHGRREHQRNSLRAHCAIPGDAPVDGIPAAVHDGLARSRSALVALQLDDVLGCVEAQNLPGTVDVHPNWRRRLPLSIDQIGASDALTETANIMNHALQDTSAKDRGVI